MKPTDPPRPTGTERVFSPEELLIAVFGRPPITFLLQIQNGPLAVPLFTSKETWERFVLEFPELALGLHLAQITDFADFLSGVPADVVLAVDVRRSETGTVKYSDLQVR